MNKKTKIALGIGAAGVLGYLILSGSGEGGAFGGGGGGGGFEPLLEPKKVTTTSTSEDPGRTTNIYNFGEGSVDPSSFFSMPDIIIERIIEHTPSISKKEGYKALPLLSSHVEAQRSGKIVVPTAEIMKETKKLSQTERAEYGLALRQSVESGRYIPSYTASPTPVKTPIATTTTKKSSTATSLIKSGVMAAITMSQPVSFAKSVSSFLSSWGR